MACSPTQLATARRTRTRHKERINAEAKVRHERKQATDPAYRVANVARARRWREDNIERNRALQREWMKNRYPLLRDDADFKRRRAAVNALRRAVKRGGQGVSVSRDVIWSRDGGICGICNLPADPTDWHLDHIRPIARGGEHVAANLQVAHPPCNMSKGARYG